MIRRYIVWRDNHARDDRLRRSSTGQTSPDAVLRSHRDGKPLRPHLVASRPAAVVEPRIQVP